MDDDTTSSSSLESEEDLPFSMETDPLLVQEFSQEEVEQARPLLEFLYSKVGLLSSNEFMRKYELRAILGGGDRDPFKKFAAIAPKAFERLQMIVSSKGDKHADVVHPHSSAIVGRNPAQTKTTCGFETTSTQKFARSSDLSALACATYMHQSYSSPTFVVWKMRMSR